MGFESNWYFAEVALLKAGAGPLTSDELGVPIALPTNHDLGFWQDLSTSQYRMWGELRRLVPGKSEQAILDQLVAEELIPPPAPRVSIYELRDVRLMEQARPRKNVTASLSRGPLPADSRVIASSAVAAMPTLVSLIRFTATLDRCVNRSLPCTSTEVFEAFLDVLAVKRPGKHVFVSVTV